MLLLKYCPEIFKYRDKMKKKRAKHKLKSFRLFHYKLFGQTIFTRKETQKPTNQHAALMHTSAHIQSIVSERERFDFSEII